LVQVIIEYIPIYMRVGFIRNCYNRYHYILYTSHWFYICRKKLTGNYYKGTTNSNRHDEPYCGVHHDILRDSPQRAQSTPVVSHDM